MQQSVTQKLTADLTCCRRVSIAAPFRWFEFRVLFHIITNASLRVMKKGILFFHYLNIYEPVHVTHDRSGSNKVFRFCSI